MRVLYAETRHQSSNAQQGEIKKRYLTWRSARLSHSDAEVWTSPPVSSEPAAGRAALWTSRPTQNSRSPGGCWTGARRSSPSCWAAKRTETRRLRPWCSSCQIWENRLGHGGADRPSAQLRLRGAHRSARSGGAAGGGASEPRVPEPKVACFLEDLRQVPS